MLTEKQKHWQTIIEQWQDSGLSQTEFCRQNQIKLQSFYSYRSFFKSRESEPADPSGGFIRLNEPANAGAGSLTVQIGRMVLHLNEHTDMSFATRWIRQLLQTVPHDTSI